MVMISTGHRFGQCSRKSILTMSDASFDASIFRDSSPSNTLIKHQEKERHQNNHHQKKWHQNVIYI
jgi:hypothetical protein